MNFLDARQVEMNKEVEGIKVKVEEIKKSKKKFQDRRREKNRARKSIPINGRRSKRRASARY